jgi:hypothetical protein
MAGESKGAVDCKCGLNKFMIMREEGAEAILNLATSDDVGERTGKFFDGNKQREVSRRCKDLKL